MKVNESQAMFYQILYVGIFRVVDHESEVREKFKIVDEIYENEAMLTKFCKRDMFTFWETSHNSIMHLCNTSFTKTDFLMFMSFHIDLFIGIQIYNAQHFSRQKKYRWEKNIFKYFIYPKNIKNYKLWKLKFHIFCFLKFLLLQIIRQFNFMTSSKSPNKLKKSVKRVSDLVWKDLPMCLKKLQNLWVFSHYNWSQLFWLGLSFKPYPVIDKRA